MTYLSECKDEIPSSCSLERFKTCSEILQTFLEDAGIDVCEAGWAESDFCYTDTPGLVKDTCRRSCGLCDPGNLIN